MIIAVEGIDGSGKTYLIEQLMQKLSQRGIKTRLYSERSIPEIGQLIENLIHSDMYDPYTHLFLATSSYLYLQHEVWQDHLNGAVVFWDRYIPSTVVYSRVLGVDEQTIQICISRLISFCHMTIFCNSPPTCALAKKDVIDNIERGFNDEEHVSAFIDFQTKIYHEYWRLINESDDVWYIYEDISCGQDELINTIIGFCNNAK